MSTYFNQRIVQSIFQTQILPWMRSSDLILALADLAWCMPDQTASAIRKETHRVSAILPKSPGHGNLWAANGLHCRSYPILLFVLEGEADFRVGKVHETPDQTVSNASCDLEISVYGLPVRSCLIIPPGVGHSDGATPHWERPGAEKANSQLLWIQSLPTGAMIHMCQTKGLTHSHTSSLFLRDSRLFLLMQFMLERAQQTMRGDDVVWSFLQTFLICIYRGEPSSHALESDGPEPESDARDHKITANLEELDYDVVERASLYIRSHLPDPLSPLHIARHAGISESQLQRAFQDQFGVSVMKYVVRHRMEEAKELLLNSRLTAQEVGESCGYPHATHFSRVFKEHSGCTPLAYRRIAAPQKRPK